MAGLLPISQNTDVVSFKIEVDGVAIPQNIPVYNIEVTHDINKIPTACIYFADGDPVLGEWPVSTGDTFIPGNEIKILAGYHGEDEEIFSGIVTGQTLRARHQRMELQVTCKGSAIAMTTTKKSRHFTDSTDSDAVFSTQVAINWSMSTLCMFGFCMLRPLEGCWTSSTFALMTNSRTTTGI